MKNEFWKTKQLHELDDNEWDALCDRCGQCCLIQLEDTQTNEKCFTRVACKKLDISTCSCKSYTTRLKEVKNCVRVTLELIKTENWLPKTCAYRLLYEGKDLEWWHPLISKDTETVHKAGISIRGWAISENDMEPTQTYEDFVEPE